MVKMQRNRYCGRPTGVSGEVDKKSVGIGDGPREEKDLGRRAFGFGGADNTNNCFEVVLKLKSAAPVQSQGPSMASCM